MPILGSAVALVVVGAIALVFYPRVARWFGPKESSVGVSVASPTATVPIWVCRSVDGVALLPITVVFGVNLRKGRSPPGFSVFICYTRYNQG